MLKSELVQDVEKQRKTANGASNLIDIQKMIIMPSIFYSITNKSLLNKFILQMGRKDQVKQQQWTLKSVIGDFLLIIASALITIIIIFLLICIHGSDVRYVDDQHILNSIFNDQLYQQLERAIDQKNLKRIEIVGSVDGGLRQFIKNYANAKTIQGKYVVMDNIYQSEKQLKPYVSQLRYELLRKIGWYRLRRYLNIQSKIHPIRIFIQTEYLSQDYFNYLLHLDPRDKVILVVSDKLPSHQIQGFTRLNFTSIGQGKFLKVASKRLKIPLKTFKVLFYHFQTIDNIFELIDKNQDALNIDQILGTFKKPQQQFNSTELVLLKNLCSKGAYKSKTITKNLYYFGIVKIKNIIYWSHPLSKLNYQLQTFERCSSNGTIPNQLKYVELDWDEQLYDEFL